MLKFHKEKLWQRSCISFVMNESIYHGGIMTSLRPIEPNRQGSEMRRVPEVTKKDQNSVSDIRDRSISQPSGFKKLDGKESADFTFRIASQKEGNVFKKIWKLFQQQVYQVKVLQ